MHKEISIVVVLFQCVASCKTRHGSLVWHSRIFRCPKNSPPPIKEGSYASGSHQHLLLPRRALWKKHLRSESRQLVNVVRHLPLLNLSMFFPVLLPDPSLFLSHLSAILLHPTAPFNPSSFFFRPSPFPRSSHHPRLALLLNSVALLLNRLQEHWWKATGLARHQQRRYGDLRLRRA